MNKLAYLVFVFVMVSTQAYPQTWIEKVGSNVKDRAVGQVENRIEDKAAEAVDKGLDKTEESVKKSGKKGKTTDKVEGEEAENNEEVNEPSASDATENDDSEETGAVSKSKTDKSASAKPQQKPQMGYSKYDFVPGNEVIFEDDLKGEQIGEFPSKWDLIEGGAEIATVDGENVLALVGYTYITPLFRNPADKYLPDAFTLEYDLLIDENEKEHFIEFLDEAGDDVVSSSFWTSSNTYNFSWNLHTNSERDGSETFDNSHGWHHCAISFNKRAMKIYMDDKRVANIPNIAVKLSTVRFFARGGSDNSMFHFKNIRIAKGAVPLYDKLMTDGKIITYGITFDVGKSTIKPQSMGTINEIVAMMQKYPELKFSVEGHTDNTGSATANQTLSEARAKSVCSKLQEMGIATSRLSAKGHGLSKPIDSNDSTEGRAKNRRVEFVKM